MSTLGLFLLAVAAFVGALMIVIDPTPKMQRWMRGRTVESFKGDLRDLVDAQDAQDIGFYLFVLLIFLPIALLYTLIVEPIYICYALVNNIGYQPLAYAMLGITLISWIDFARAFFSKQPKKDLEGIEDQKIDLPNPVWAFVKRFFFALPTLYLTYLFIVMVFK
jgi:hypothetical protein